MDWETAIKETDKQNMKDVLLAFPDQCRQGYELGKKLENKNKKEIKNVLITGMGGSGFSGTLAKNIFLQEAKIPIESNQGYEMPLWAGENTLVVAVSYSGNTEETLAVFGKAMQKKALAIGICSAGFLAEKAENKIIVPKGIQPRNATGYLFFSATAAMENRGIIENQENRVLKLTKFLEQVLPETIEESKQIALRLQNRFPIIYAPEEIGCTANRWQTMIEECAKALCHSNIIPEQNHNEINSENMPEDSTIVFLRTGTEHRQLKKRIDFTRKKFSEQGIPCIEAVAKGTNKLEKTFHAIMLGDWTAFHLAVLKKQDPAPVPVIEKLKKALKE